MKGEEEEEGFGISFSTARSDRESRKGLVQENGHSQMNEAYFIGE